MKHVEERIFIVFLNSGKYHRNRSYCFLHPVAPKFKQYFNPFPNKPWFLRVCGISLLKTLRETEKLLVTSNFSFSHSVFYLFEEISSIFNEFEIVICKTLSVWKSPKFVVWERVKAIKSKGIKKWNLHSALTLYNNPLENIVGKEENVGTHHFLLFLQCFQKCFFFFFSDVSKVLTV